MRYLFPFTRQGSSKAARLRPLALFLAFALLSPTGCNRAPEETYQPPSFAGMAYVLADSDHIAALDLGSQRVSRISLGKKGADLALLDNRLFVLAADGTLAEIDQSGKKGDKHKWQPAVAIGRDMTIGPQNTLWILGDGELAFFAPDKGVTGKKKLQGHTDYIFFEPKSNRLWCINRQKSTLTALNGSSFAQEIVLEQVGNSVHDGFVGPEGTDFWLAEGNEYMDGKPYGVGYATGGPAMMGGVNVIDIKTGKMIDFVMVGGNTTDLALSPDGTRTYAALSQHPDYNEATLAMIDNTSGRRVKAEFRLCDTCHLDKNVKIKNGKAFIKALAVAWPTGAAAGSEPAKLDRP